MHLTGQDISDIFIAITVMGASILYARNRIPQQNVKNLTALTNTYEKRIKALEEEIKENHKVQLENVAAISDLQGQIKVYKELPLQQLADGLKETVMVNKENAAVNKENAAISRQILEQLQSTAQIAAEDRDVLTNQNKHIKTEVHKIINEEVNRK